MDVVEQSIEILKKGNFIAEDTLRTICTIAKGILVEESTVRNIQSPVTVCGDIHGQFSDLLHIFELAGDAAENKYVFLGDFVDRGNMSVESFEMLLCLKVKYPENITLLRGNHESRQITQVYGFYTECVNKYGSPVAWKLCTDVFDCLGIAAVIDNEVMCVHGGLSPQLGTLDLIRGLDRFQEAPLTSSICDLMWSDPEEGLNTPWCLSPRGAGYLFGADAVTAFNHINNLQLIARSHQLVDEGYKYHFLQKNLVTVWSAPNYCYRCGNLASVLCFDENMRRDFKIFDQKKADQSVNSANSKPQYFI